MGAESKMLKDYITDATKQKEAQQRFRETFSFLKDHEIKLFKIEAVDYRDGNYTGEVNDQKERHGWGEMYWKNGTVYGPGNIFIYSHGDRYVGQWLNNKQDGKLSRLRDRHVLNVAGKWFCHLQFNLVLKAVNFDQRVFATNPSWFVGQFRLLQSTFDLLWTID